LNAVNTPKEIINGFCLPYNSPNGAQRRGPTAKPRIMCKFVSSCS
jgi:hypothetical protein